MMELSFVIPVYNARPYIEQCVSSCSRWAIAHGLNYEILLIDDGSTDGSDVLCDQLAQQEHVRIRHQVNQGVSVARNLGITLAQGKWIWFVDADDYLEQTQNIHLPELTDDTNFVIAGFVWEEKGEIMRFGAKNHEVPYNLWRCWMRKDLIEQYQLTFTVGRKYAEDQEFILGYLLSVHSRKTACIDVPLYHYTMRPGSAMTKAGQQRKQLWDVAAVFSCFLWKSLITGRIIEPWCRGELKRIAKNLLINARHCMYHPN